MKIHAYLLCFNEEQIIARTIGFYSRFCSRIFVMDNESTDRSAAIARSYPHVEVITWKSNGIFDRRLAAKMRSQAYRSYSRADGKHCREAADWIIVSDMDELVYHPDLPEVLKRYRSQGVTVPHTTGFEMVGPQDLRTDIPLIDQYKKGYRSASMDKRLVFDARFDMTYSHGCHPRGPGFELMKQSHGYKSSNEFPIAVLHYKHIGSRYYATALKNFQRAEPGSVFRSKDGRYHGVGCHYFEIVEKRIKTSPLLDCAQHVFAADRPGEVLFERFPGSCGDAGFGAQQPTRLPAKDIEYLRDLAIRLESDNLPAALRLMEIAHAACPSGHRIRDKVFEYRRALKAH